VRSRRGLATVAAGVLLLVSACGTSDETPGGERGQQSPGSSLTTGDREGLAEKAERESREQGAQRVEHVVAISVDGLAVVALERLGAAGAPTFHRMLAEGAGTLNARTAYEENITLPNHVGMVTGRPIAKAAGGHGVTWNSDLPDDTVQAASGDPRIESIFSVAHDAGLTTALFAGKSKFDILTDSWPEAFDHQVVREEGTARPDALVGETVDHLVEERPNLTFLHLAHPDAIGHAYGGMTRPYLRAVRAVDTGVTDILATIEGDDELRDSTLVVLTADHGVTRGEKTHLPHLPTNYAVPFVVWGAGVQSGDLYALNPDLADPGRSRPSYDGPQPVRNLQLAGVVLDALALPGMEEVEVGELAW